MSAEDRIAVVTGGNRGIGREVARQISQIRSPLLRSAGLALAGDAGPLIGG